MPSEEEERPQASGPAPAGESAGETPGSGSDPAAGEERDDSSAVAERLGELAAELGVLARIRLDLLREDLRKTGWRGLSGLWLGLVAAAATVAGVVLLLTGLAGWLGAVIPAGAGVAQLIVGGGTLLAVIVVARGMRAGAERRRLAALRRKYGDHEDNGKDAR
jgi:hypothetical protein